MTTISHGKVLGTITAVVGEAKATAADGTTRVLQVGDQVFMDDAIFTSPQGYIHVQLQGGHSVDCGNDARITLNEITLGQIAVAAAPSEPVQQDVAALQSAIAAGADPTQVADATAAGGAPGAESGGGHTFIVLEQANTAAPVTSGFATHGPGVLSFPVLAAPPSHLGESGGNADSFSGQIPASEDVRASEAGPNLTGTFSIPAGETPIVVATGLPQDQIVQTNDVFTNPPIGTLDAPVNPDAGSLLAPLVINNSVPVAFSDSNWTQEGSGAISGNVLQSAVHTGAPSGNFSDATDADANGDPLTVSTVGTFAGSFGTLTLNADGSYTYVVDNANPAVQALNNGDVLADTFAYAVTDGTASSAAADLTITIFGANHAPTFSVPNVVDAVFEDGIPAGPQSTVSGTFSVADPEGDPIALSRIDFLASGSSSPATVSASGTSAVVDTGNGTLTLGSADDGHTWNWTYVLDNPSTDAANVTEADLFNVTVTDGVNETTIPIAANVMIVDDVPQGGGDSGIVDNAANAVLHGDSGIGYGADGIGAAPTIAVGTLPAGWSATQASSTEILLDSATGHARIVLDPATGQYTFTLLDPIGPQLVSVPLDSSTIKPSGPTDAPITVDFAQTDVNVTFSAPTATGGFDYLNISQQGIGIGNNLIDSERGSPLETLRMDFTAHGHPVEVPTVGITVDKFGGNDVLVFRTYDAEGSLVDSGHVSSGTTNQGAFTFSVADSTVNDGHADPFTSLELSFTPGDAKTSYVVTTLEIQQTVAPQDAAFTFNVTGTDGDGDTTTSVIAVNVNGDPAVGGTNSLVHGDLLVGDGVIIGGAGDDTVTGGSGNDSLFGSDGNDIVSGGAGNDSLFGDGGHDVLTGDAGNDILVGGPGSDVFKFADLSADTVKDFTVAPAAAGGDVLDLSEVLPGVSVTDPNFGAYVDVHTVGSNTVISIDADGAGSGAGVPVATLEGIAGVTLQQLLQNNQIVT